MLPRLRVLTLLPVSLVTLLPGTDSASAPRPVPVEPRLIVVITIDQFRGDYLQRWAGQWQGGFHRLLSEGAVFPHALQDHAVTETAPGHATILSGRSPASTGIVLNSLGVPDSTAPLLGTAGPGASPRRFQGTTLVDWLRARAPATQFLSVSQKDRGAILPIGRSRGPVFWFDHGRFTTSRYYADSLPDWLLAWSARGPVAALAGRTWPLLLPDSAYSEPDDAAWEHGGTETAFPHRLPSDSGGVVSELPETPWMDSLTLDLALTGTRALGLGTRGTTDLLAISLSATDHIGHAWGPDSRELHDHLLRLDRWLGDFLDQLAARVPRDRILLVLTADHGVTAFPERVRSRRGDAGRVPLGRIIADLNRELAPRVGTSHLLAESSGLVYLADGQAGRAGIDRVELSHLVQPRIGALPGVSAVWTPETLHDGSGDTVAAARWRRSLAPGLVWVACAAIRPGYIWADNDGYTTHGTTNPDDVSVPIGFLGAAIRPGLRPDTIRTIDIAPTLAELLGLHPSGRLDGRSVLRLLARP